MLDFGTIGPPWDKLARITLAKLTDQRARRRKSEHE